MVCKLFRLIIFFTFPHFTHSSRSHVVYLQHGGVVLCAVSRRHCISCRVRCSNPHPFRKGL